MAIYIYIYIFFFFFSYQGPDRGGRRAMEKIERKNVQREKERETCSGEGKSQLYKYFGLRNKYRMY